MRTDRRTFLTAGAAGLVFSTAAGAPAYAARRTRKRAYVLVIDGCRPDEIEKHLRVARAPDCCGRATQALLQIRDFSDAHPRKRRSQS